MEALPSIPLVDRLRAVAGLWCAAQEPEATLARLGKLAIGDGAFFDRVGAARGPTTGTLDKFAAFFADPANWPEGAVPQEAKDFAHVTGVAVLPPESEAA